MTQNFFWHNFQYSVVFTNHRIFCILWFLPIICHRISCILISLISLIPWNGSTFLFTNQIGSNLVQSLLNTVPSFPSIFWNFQFKGQILAYYFLGDNKIGAVMFKFFQQSCISRKKKYFFISWKKTQFFSMRIILSRFQIFSMNDSGVGAQLKPAQNSIFTMQSQLEPEKKFQTWPELNLKKISIL